MKPQSVICCFVSFAIVLIVSGNILSAQEVASQKKPNVVLILADDMGIDSVSSLNLQMGLKTPALDQLAKQGITFLDAHSTSAVCSPTRYGLLTGRYNWRSRLKRGIVGKWERPLIATSRLTLPEMFQKSGYQTAMIGKWHLGWNWPKKGGGYTEKLSEIDFTKPTDGGPNDHGFDYYFGDDVPNWPPYAWRENKKLIGNLTTQMKEGTMVGVRKGPAVENWDFRQVLLEYTKRCTEFVEKQKDQTEPFFLYYSMPSPHTPIAPGGKFQGISKISPYADFLIETDWSVGQLLAKLEETGQAENTIVIFTCDNGTSPKANFQLLEKNQVQLRKHWRGHKADIFEGGHRVPLMVRWPGNVPSGIKSKSTVVLTDIMATCAEILRFELPESAAEDSISLVPELMIPENLVPKRNGTQKDQRLHDFVIHHSSRGFFAIRSGDWKLLLCRGSGGWSPPSEAVAARMNLPMVQLYNLKSDPLEATNLAMQNPEKVGELVKKLSNAFRSGRTTPGPDQTNEGWPGVTIPKPILKKFPILQGPNSNKKQ